MTDLEPGYEALPQAPRHRRGRLFASIGAVLVLAAGAVTSYVAFAGADATASSGQQAVQRVLSDLEHADLVGVLDDLVPSERTALSGAVTDDIAALKRLGVLTSTANPSAVSGVRFAVHDLRFGAPIKVTDDVQLVQITGGTVDLNVAAAQLPFTQRLLGLARHPATSAKRFAITHPVRIAAQRVAGHWYASLFYTIADRAAHQQLPTSADYIAPTATGTPVDAVQNFVHAAFSGDIRTAISLISPTELAVVHDYGGLLARAVEHSKAPPVKLQTLDLTSAPTSGGVKIRVHDAVLTVMGFRVSVSFDNGCMNLDAGFLTKQICRANAADQLGSLLGLLCARAGHAQCTLPHLTAAQQAAVGDLVSGLFALGIVVTHEGGGWFIAPVRTLADASTTLLSGLRGDDVFELAGIAR